MADLIKLRRDTEANWNLADPILANGEITINTDNDLVKVGNGVDPWSLLPYANQATLNRALHFT